jgi:hypothetical protein
MFHSQREGWPSLDLVRTAITGLFKGVVTTAALPFSDPADNARRRHHQSEQPQHDEVMP